MATTFSYYDAYVDNGSFTFTAPESNYYKFFAWGRSGNGGAATGSTLVSGGYSYSPAGGSGGGSGGFCASQVYLSKGETVTISISASVTTVTRTGLNMQATAGGDAGPPSSGYASEAGAGGNAYGGNIANLSGFSGGKGGDGKILITQTPPMTVSDASAGITGENAGAQGGAVSFMTGGGGGGARLPGSDFCRYIISSMSSYKGGDAGGDELNDNGRAPSVLPAPVKGSNITLCGGGSGAGGHSWTSAATIPGGTGTPGVVIIEKQDNQPPTDPSGLTYTGNIKAGNQITLTTGGSTDPDGDAIQYVWEYRTDTGPYIQIGITAATSITATVPTTGTLYQARVKAVDSAGLESGYFTGAAVAISYNDPPAIHDSVAGTDLGDLTAQGLTYTYSVTDDKDSQVGVQLWVDGELAASPTVPVGVTQTFVLDQSHWQRLLNGGHTLTVIATDSESERTTRTLSFQRWQRVVEFTLAAPKATGSRARRIAAQLGSYRPEGSKLTVLATNNALDAAPVWEDMTQASENNRVHVFANQNKTAAEWAINLHVTLERGVAVGDCFISGLALGYETDSGAAATVANLSEQVESTEQLLDIILTQVIPGLIGGEAQ